MTRNLSVVGSSSVLADRFDGTIFCEIGDLIFYLRRHDYVSGIQRVLSSTVSAVRDLPRYFGGSVIWCLTDPISNELCRIEEASLHRLISAVRHGRTRDELDGLIARIDAGLEACSPRAGDMLFVMGAFWVSENTPATLMRMRRRGVRTALLVYDLIPITHPEFCDAGLTSAFSSQMRGLLSTAECAVAISEHVRKELALLVDRLGLQVPIAAVPLGMDDVPPLAPKDTREHGLRAEIDGEYVLVVGTIEIRKNHSYVFNIWRQMLADRGPGEVPKLVLVGRRGWRVDDLLAQFEATDGLSGHIILLETVTDSELDALYRDCLFTMFVSYTEGWGLPVGESLARGKLCVASRAASIPEVGGDFAMYVDPYNVSEGRELVERLLADRSIIEAKESSIVASFRPNTWNDYAQRLFESVTTLINSVEPRRAVAVYLPEATWLPMGACDDPKNNPALACVDGWYPREDWGRWMSARDAVIEFNAEPSTTYRFVMHVAVPPWLTDHGLKIFGAGVDELIIDRIPLDGIKVSTQVRTAEDGIVRLRFRTTGRDMANPTDPRRLYAGIQRILYYSMDNVMNYVRGVEQLAMSSLHLIS